MSLIWSRPPPAVHWPCVPSTFSSRLIPKAPLSASFTACVPYLLHPLYQFLPLSISLQTHMPSLLRGRLDSVTHHGASVRASLVLLLSFHTLCPSGLVFTESAALSVELSQVERYGEEWENVRKMVVQFIHYNLANNLLNCLFFLTVSICYLIHTHDISMGGQSCVHFILL